MSILLPVLIGGLAGIVAFEGRAEPTHPAAAYADAMTAQFAQIGGPVTLSYTYDEATETLRVTGQLSQVVSSRNIRLFTQTLMDHFVETARASVDAEALQRMGVGVEYALVDRNRTPLQA
jgi:hypothetical protein